LRSQTLKGASQQILSRFFLPSPRRNLGVVIPAGLVLGSFGYYVSAYPQLPSWVVSSPGFGGPSSVFNAPSGINGSIAYNRGAVSCSLPFPDPQGSVLVQGLNGNIVQVSVQWNPTQCDLKTGVFRILEHLGNYHVSLTRYPMTLPPQTVS